MAMVHGPPTFVNCKYKTYNFKDVHTCSNIRKNIKYKLKKYKCMEYCLTTAVKYSIPTYSLVVNFLSIFSLLLDFPGLQQKVTLLFPPFPFDLILL